MVSQRTPRIILHAETNMYITAVYLAAATGEWTACSAWNVSSTSKPRFNAPTRTHRIIPHAETNMYITAVCLAAATGEWRDCSAWNVSSASESLAP